MRTRALTLAVLLLIAAAVLSGRQDTPLPAAPKTQTQVLVASDAAPSANLGFAVAIDGDTLVLGARQAPYEDDPYHGAVYVFVRGAGGWTLEQKILPDDAGGHLQFGRAVAISGETIVVGARLPEQPGVAYVFTRTGGVWTQQAKLTDASAEGFDFGYSVAIDGDRILVGDPEASSGAGLAHVFNRTDGVWGSARSFGGSFDAAVAGAEFGFSVALHGGTALIGAPGSNVSGPASGEADVYSVVSPYGLTARLVAPGGAGGDSLGFSVALHGDVAVAGAPYVNSSTGAAYVAVRGGGAWSALQRIDAFIDSDARAVPGTYDYFGWSLDVEGDRIVVGTLADRTVYVFDRTTSTWGGTMTLVPSGTMSNNFGFATALSETTIIAGGPSDDPVDDGSDSDDQGVGYVFELGLEVSRVTPSAGPTAGGTTVTVTGSGFEDGATVTFGGQAATSVTVVDAETLTCVTPAHAAGAVDVVVDLPGNRPGPASVTLEDGYLYADLDLKALAFLGPAWAGQGETIALSNKVLNLGPDASPATRVHYYLSADKTVNWPGGYVPADSLLGGWDVDALAARTFDVGGASVAIPPGVAAGVYNLLAVADGDEAVQERLETNNLKSRVIKIGSDLVVSALGAPRAVGRGVAFDLRDTTKNLPWGGGAPASQTRFYLSLDKTYGGGDVYLGSRPVGALARGGSSAASTPVTVPGDTAPGRYFLLAIADFEGDASEWNESNNVKARPVTVVIPVGAPVRHN